MEVIEQAGEEAEERLLLEQGLLFMHVGKDQNEDGQNLRQVVDLCLVVVNSGSVAVVLDDVHNQPGHGVQGLEGESELSRIDVLDVAVDARLGAHAEEERGDIFRF